MNIELRSDTFTEPVPEMREAMARAKVGDDVFGEDPSVNELQERAADLLGKEAALFVPSGVMGNQTLIYANAGRGDEVIVEENAHIFYYEAASPAILSGVQLSLAKSNKGVFEIEEIERRIRPKNVHFPKTALVCVENTHNRYGGTVYPLEKLKELGEFLRERGVKFHCDGARLWEACAATGVSPKEYAEPFDSISVCFSKGLGAPVGSLAAGSEEIIERARKARKIFGGGMRQAGIIAAGALYALQNHLELLPAVHKRAKNFARIIAKSESVELDPEEVQTNIVIFKISELVSAERFLGDLNANGVKLLSIGDGYYRAVFHFQVSDEQAKLAGEIVCETLNKLTSRL